MSDVCNKEKDPATFDSAHQAAVKHALETKYSLLPELHTLFYQSHTQEYFLSLFEKCWVHRDSHLGDKEVG